MANGNRDNTIKIAFLAIVGVAFVFLCVGILLRYIGPSPLPKPIFTQLQRMDATGKTVQQLAGRAKAVNSPEALLSVQTEYESVKVSFNQALQQVRDGLNLNALDSSDTLSTLAVIETNETALRDQLQPLSQPTLNADTAPYLDFLWKFVEAGVTSWSDLIKDKGDVKQRAAEMLQKMQWPDWVNIEKSR